MPSKPTIPDSQGQPSIWVYCIVRDSRSGCSNDFKSLDHTCSMCANVLVCRISVYVFVPVSVNRCSMLFVCLSSGVTFVLL